MGSTKRSAIAVAAVLCLGLFGAASCARAKPGTFKTPEEAVQALADLIGAGDKQRVEEIFGPDSFEMFSSGDEVADQGDFQRVKSMILESVAFKDDDETTKIVLLGKAQWPFPIPLVLEEGRWRFDTAAGREELENRRVGRNELLTIAALREAVEAQREYHAEGRDGLPPAYAQKIRSSRGKHDGLYWPTNEGEPLSPLGELFAQAAARGYHPDEEPTPDPYSGYYFDVLKGQGKNAPGGERGYLDKNGLMTGGFAAIAWPAKYGNSGVMTFMVSDRGMVFQKDLGKETDKIAKAITVYDPDLTWDPTPD